MLKKQETKLSIYLGVKSSVEKLIHSTITSLIPNQCLNANIKSSCSTGVSK